MSTDPIRQSLEDVTALFRENRVSVHPESLAHVSAVLSRAAEALSADAAGTTPAADERPGGGSAPQ